MQNMYYRFQGKIRSQEVVRRGFMSDFYFKIFPMYFMLPKRSLTLLHRLLPFLSQAKSRNCARYSRNSFLDESGGVSLEEGYVIGKSAEIFGKKIFEDIPDKVKRSDSRYPSGTGRKNRSCCTVKG